MTYKFGRLHPTGNEGPALMLGPLLTGVVPPHPTSVDYITGCGAFPMDDNDRYGDCGPAAVAHNLQLVTAHLGTIAVPSVAQVLGLYSQSTNPPFNPATGANDSGVYTQTMLKALATNGIDGHTPAAYAKVNYADLEELRAAEAIFGSILYGVNLFASQVNTKLWDTPDGNEGHLVCGVRYSENPDRTGLITWGMTDYNMTDRFVQSGGLEEAWVIIWPEHFGSKAFLEGVNVTQLAADYLALTGHTLVIPPQPQPYEPRSAVNFTAIEPTRLVDSRSSLGTAGRLAAKTWRKVQITGGVIPVNATAITGNVTIVTPAAAGWLVLAPAMTVPTTSTVNFAAGQAPIANGFTLGLAPDGTLVVYSYAAVDFIIDVTGYFA